MTSKLEDLQEPATGSCNSPMHIKCALCGLQCCEESPAPLGLFCSDCMQKQLIGPRDEESNTKRVPADMVTFDEDETEIILEAFVDAYNPIRERLMKRGAPPSPSLQAVFDVWDKLADALAARQEQK